MISNIKVAALGGGTGLSTMLKGLKLYTGDITAVVSVADDGGSSGMLRQDFGMLPPGDVRNCLSALTDIDPEIGDLINYRFREGGLKGHSLGNIMLAALNDMSGSFEEAVKKFARVLGIVGTVYPVTNENVTLKAVLSNNKTISGESNIGAYSEAVWNRIDHVELNPPSPKPVRGAVEAINKADVIVLGPGSLYTSIIPNLLVSGITEAIRNSRALKIYVCNIMTQRGETEGYTAYDHLSALEKHSYEGIADMMIVNNATVPEYLLERYAGENAAPVHIDTENILGHTKLVQGNLLLIQNGRVRHNFSRLARTVVQLGSEFRN